MSTKHLYIVRGLPGSGKSTIAKLLCIGNWPHCHCEADMWFVDRETGDYNWKPEQTAKAHAWCQDAIREAMAADKEVVVVSNTFTRQWEMQPYREMAKAFGYTVTTITVDSGLGDGELAARNIHSVPQEAIAKMRERWES